MTTVTRAPGRVNLLGEHTDYNDGFVLPVAIDRFTTVEASERDDGLITAESIDLDENDCFRLESVDRTGTWRDYVRGVVRLARPAAGAHLRISSTIPRGVGLSSSAALEIAVARALTELPGPELALLCQEAENDFVGVQCGIMDQFTAANARAGHALLLDCRDLSFEHIPIPDGMAILVCDSHIERRLAGSAYNERRAACSRAAEELGWATLRDATPNRLDALPLELRKRARHVISENERTLEGAEALKTGDVERFGVLMNESHASLRDDYEVCPPALDELAAAIRRATGVHGARLTGGGFGGCVVAIGEAAAVEEGRQAAEKLGATVYECKPADGVTRQSTRRETNS